MTNPTPLLFDTYYHIFNRGNNRENIFLEERNYSYFLNLYDLHLAIISDLYAYCLMRNHFHLLVRIRSEEEIAASLKTKDRLRLKPLKGAGAGVEGVPAGYASRQFSNFFNAYAKAINNAYGRTGSLFQHNFRRVPVTSDRQFWNVVAYIHQNPQKLKFVGDFREWKYSSYGVIVSEERTNLKRSEVLAWFGGKQGYADLHKQWVTDAQSREFAEKDAD